MGSVRLWTNTMRAPFFTGSVVPVVVGAAVAWHHTGVMSWPLFAITLVGAVAAHAGANLANDYFDHRLGADEINADYVRPFTGGSRVIQDGVVPAASILRASGLAFLIAVCCGAYLFSVTRGWLIVWLALAGGFMGVMYTAPPVKAVYRGFGEVFIGLSFGVLLVLGTEYVLSGAMTLTGLLASIPVAILIITILYINEFQDAPSDEAAKKLHWVVRLGRRRAARGYAILLALTYLSIIASVAFGVVPVWALLGCVPIVMAAKAVQVAFRYFDDGKRLVPANAATIGMHLATGLLIAAGFVIDKAVGG
jgi:1,4-dihydroxy-2-naphthoate octaprenyltransferase